MHQGRGAHLAGAHLAGAHLAGAHLAGVQRPGEAGCFSRSMRAFPPPRRDLGKSDTDVGVRLSKIRKSVPLVRILMHCAE
jgi:hypothetical protein